ncbi:hypothetical protein LSH36_288g01062 [Paralvinella palmiformis]|uniref:Uncharacterized protein n=1 Tax=Paralvinella palmiformis TaxID=53620 RepID=A0AAD9N1X7_9ANNE|nr:hypothetical protein LSH36_288g01062 [Paralvinella palmiformis]
MNVLFRQTQTLDDRGYNRLIYEPLLFKQVRWECSQRIGRSYKGTFLTDLQITKVVDVTEHFHETDLVTVQTAKVKESMKQQVPVNRGTPGQLIIDSTVNAAIAIRAATGDPEVVKRTIRRQSAKHRPKKPTATRLVIPDEWKTTGGDNPHNFIVYNNGPDSRSRMLVFCVDTALYLLARSSSWMMDGTFDTAPNIFSQLYAAECF